VRTGAPVDLGDQCGQAQLGAVDRDRLTAREAQHQVLRLVRGVRGRHRTLEDLLGRCLPGVLEDPALGGAAPQVLVDRVRRVLADRDRHAALVRPHDRGLA